MKQLSFEERMGLPPTETIIQRQSINNQLRNELWSMTYIMYFEGKYDLHSLKDSERMLFTRIWMYSLGKPYDELPYEVDNITIKIKARFMTSSWLEVFKELQFIPNNYNEEPDDDGKNEMNIHFYKMCNTVLERNMSAYRFINGLLTEITSSEEIDSITNSLDATKVQKPVVEHLMRALELFSDRENPDYRNSIKESISAVESYCRLVGGGKKTSLSKALATLESKHNLHSALKSAFLALYNYSSDEDGIRHGLLNESKLEQEDAKFMLVACSAFINYLTVKTT